MTLENNKLVLRIINHLYSWAKTRPSIQLLHRIFNQYCVMKKRDMLPTNEMDRKIYKIVIFSYQYKILEI